MNETNNQTLIKCEVCSKEFLNLKKLNAHLGQTKCLSIKDYFDKYFKKDSDGYCNTCGKQTKFINLTIGYNKYCNSKCAHNSDIIKSKTKKTCLEKYGVEYSCQSDQMKEASKKTMIERYGCEHALQVPEFQKKFKDTCVDRFGVDHAMKCIEVKQKVVDAFQENYGVEHPFKLDDIKQKTKATIINKYGVDNVSKCETIKEKKKETCIEHYGCDYNFQSKQVKDKIKQKLIDRYGVDNFSKTDQKKQFMREYIINRIEQQKFNGEPMFPFIGEKSRECLNEIQSIFNITIEREKKIIGYFADGFIEKLNLIIEFDEAHHFNSDGSYKENDIIREKNLKSKGYTVFRIKQSEWKDSKDGVVEKFRRFLLEI